MIESGADITMENALNATNALLLRALRTPNVVDMPFGPVTPPDLPLQVVTQEQTQLKHVFDVVGPIDFPLALKEQVTQICKESRFHDLPEPFCLKESPGRSFDFQVAAVPMPENGKYYLLKHIIFPEKEKVEQAQGQCYGQCHMLQWQGNAKNVKKAFQYMFEKMGGFQVQAFTLQASGVGGGGGGPHSDEKSTFHQNLTEEAMEAGYIETHGPRTHHANT